MLRRLARALVLLIAVSGLIPGARALVEQAVALAATGHFAASVPGDADLCCAEDGCPCCAEHGCAPSGQTCACPHVQPGTEQGRAEVCAFPSDHWAALNLASERPVRRAPSARRFSPNDRVPANRATAPPTPPANA